MGELPQRAFVDNASRLASRFIRRESHCLHVSHGRWGWFCWRLATYDGFCAKHNRSCFAGCPDKQGANAEQPGGESEK